MKLSILDQSPLTSNGDYQQALQHTLSLAKAADQLGFHRFWVSEHHASSLLAGSAPEVLLGALGAITEHIRLGSGGIMLPHYSSYKVAEVFSLLANLYPNRIDLGVGRAPGTDMATARALANGRQPDFYQFPQQLKELCQRLHDKNLLPLLSPQTHTPPPVWVLGTSPDSAHLAARLGLPYNIARFINGDSGQTLIDIYRREFQASSVLTQPQVVITMDVIVAPTEDEALVRSLSWQVVWAQIMRGVHDICLPSIGEAAKFAFSTQERAALDHKIALSAIGSPDQVWQQLSALSENLGIDEIMTVSIMQSFDQRLESCHLLAQAAGLQELTV
ncbi:MAG: LLM class flavin-dependent oxidoreductase [Parahaliea sp.]